VALDDTRWVGDPPNVKCSLQLLATFMHALRGNRACALATAQTLVDGHLRGRGPWSLWANVYYAARIAALFEEREMLERHLTRLEQSAGGVAAPPTQMNQLEPLRGQRAWLAGDREAAIAHWQHALENEASIDRLGHGIETRLFLTTALLDAGRAAEAAAALAPVPARVAAGAGIGAVLIARPALCRLADADWRGSIDLALLQHLRRWQALAQGGSTTAAPPQALQLGGLSSRELEVVARIAAGDSNKLIARAFDLSPHTVKRHVANVLDKLGLQSRGQVAAWYLAQH
jgi:LuxR family maltose regulon positive regulatory protein